MRTKVLTSNIGQGAECRSGCLDAVESQITRWDPDAVAVNEICRSGYEEFQTRHPDWTCAFRPMTLLHPGCGCDKGDMLAAPDLLTDVTITDLPGDPDHPSKHFGVLAGTIMVGKTPVRVCATHLVARYESAAQPLKEEQVRALHQIAKGWPRVIICGDFNMKPGNPALNVLERHGYIEADEADNLPTKGTAKFDHIWFRSESGIHTVSGGVIVQPSSAHSLLRGAVDW